MKTPWNWIGEFLQNPSVSAEEAAERLNLSGLEVEGVEEDVLLAAPTSNRGDLQSVRGVARELAALGLGTFNDPTPNLAQMAPGGDTGGLVVTLQDTDGCPLYLGCLVTGVTVAPSPPEIQKKLAQAGMRPINNVVDATNVVNLALGQPMHAFDASALAGNTIVVRRAQAGETLQTLDHAQRTLTGVELVIADAQKPVALAGVMGGAHSEVSDGTGEGEAPRPATTAIVLESAWFAPAAVRRTAKAHGLRTEASARFEKGADPAAAAQGMALCLQLIKRFCPGAKVHAVVQAGAAPPPAPAVPLRWATLTRLLGVTLNPADVRRGLGALGFTLSGETDEGILATPPGWRHDVNEEADLVEEAARLHGLENIAPAAPVQPLVRGRLPALRRFERRLADLLCGMGFNEALTYSMANAQEAAVNLAGDAAPLAIANPLTDELTHLRQSLLPSLVKVARHNLRHRRGEVAVFEIGKVFGGTVAEPEEAMMLGLLLCGPCPKALRPRPEPPGDFFALKGVVAQLLATLGLRDVLYTPVENDALNRRRAARLGAGIHQLGWLGEVHPVLARQLQLEQTAVYAELDLSALHRALPQRPVTFVPVNLQPGVVRDVALLVAEAVSVQALLAEARHAGGALLKDAWVFDLFRGGALGEGQKSVALSLKLEKTEGSLTEQEASAVVAQVVSALAQRFGARQR